MAGACSSETSKSVRCLESCNDGILDVVGDARAAQQQLEASAGYLVSKVAPHLVTAIALKRTVDYRSSECDSVSVAEIVSVFPTEEKTVGYDPRAEVGRVQGTKLKFQVVDGG